MDAREQADPLVWSLGVGGNCDQEREYGTPAVPLPDIDPLRLTKANDDICPDGRFTCKQKRRNVHNPMVPVCVKEPHPLQHNHRWPGCPLASGLSAL